MAYRINEERCIGCGACAWVCLFNVPALADDGVKYTIAEEKCVGCGQCDKVCPNDAVEPLPGQKKIRKVTIDAQKCIGCSLCSRVCPEHAPFGEIKKPFTIMQEKCFQCGVCAAKCRYDAIVVEYE